MSGAAAPGLALRMRALAADARRAAQVLARAPTDVKDRALRAAADAVQQDVLPRHRVELQIGWGLQHQLDAVGRAQTRRARLPVHGDGGQRDEAITLRVQAAGLGIDEDPALRLRGLALKTAASPPAHRR